MWIHPINSDSLGKKRLRTRNHSGIPCASVKINMVGIGSGPECNLVTPLWQSDFPPGSARVPVRGREGADDVIRSTGRHNIYRQLSYPPAKVTSNSTFPAVFRKRSRRQGTDAAGSRQRTG